jgi:hypothetical protein
MNFPRPHHHSSILRSSAKPRHGTSQRGFALVITLSLLVLMTFVALAFLSKTQRARQIQSASTAGTTASELARSAAGIIISDLQEEIEAEAGSDNLGDANAPFFWPSAAANWSPLRRTVRPESPETRLLVKQSMPGGAFTLGSPLTTKSTSKNTATPSGNGRVVPASRWDTPGLIRKDTEDDRGSFADADLPFWINIGPDGLSDAHGKDVVGRFAFNVYDLSGLPDIAVAGRPTGSDFDKVSGPARFDFAGSAGANPVPGVQAASWDNYPLWRFAQSVSGPGDLPGRFPEISAWLEERGFSKSYPSAPDVTPLVPPQEKRLSGRQDLANYILGHGSASFTGSILPFVRTHSASANQPAWYPPERPRHHNDTSTIDYRALSVGNNAQNPLFAKVRVQNAFTRRDGSRAEPGEPLMKRRFPLSKLALVASATASSPASGEAARREQYFGLQWDNAAKRWNYSQYGPGTTIKTLATVAGENREPNFFEVLKAGILSGSLGKFVHGASRNTPVETSAITGAVDKNPDQQIFQIGAALIDQYDADDIPTLILGPEALVHGIENHPYIAQIFQVRTRRRDKDYNPADIHNPTPWAASWLRFQMWNPHANAAPNNYQYRIIGTGGETGITLTRYKRTLTIDPATSQVTLARVTDTPYQDLTTAPLIDQGRLGNEITFGGTVDFSSPTMLTTANADSPDKENRYAVGGADLVGFFLGDVRADNNWEAAAWTPIIGPATANSFCTVNTPPNAGVTVANPYPDNYYPNDYFAHPNGPEFVNVWSPPARYNLEVQIDGEWRILQQVPPIFVGIGNNLLASGSAPDQARPNFNPASPPNNGKGAEGNWIGLWASTRDFHNNPRFANFSFLRSDPRSFRFGLINTTVGYGKPGDVAMDSAAFAAPPATLLPKANPERAFTGWYAWGGINNATQWFKGDGDNYGPWDGGTRSSAVALGEFMFNSKGRYCYYPDRDGIVRLGDWGYSVGAEGTAALNPMSDHPVDGRAVRPVILNRPFRSVAEMGYAFRGDPWKSVNFHGEDSADGGLLELFSLADADTTKGRININKASEQVIQGMISDAATSAFAYELGGASPGGSKLTPAEVKALAKAIHDQLQLRLSDDEPIEQLSQIPALIESAGQPDIIGRSSATRGVVARALADNTDLRTWHLLIDVIAQAGLYPQSLANPDSSDFVVQGEARYWVHVAIDRHSAEVLDIQWESVQE